MWKKFLSLLAVILFLNVAVTSAARIEPVTDKAGLLKPTEVELLNQRIRDVEQKHKIKIGVVFVKSVGNKDMLAASDELRDKYFSNGKNGGIVLLVAMDKRKYEIATDSRMVQQITDSDGIPYLKDKFQSELSNGNYYGAAENFVKGVSELVSYYETHGVAYGQRAPGELDPMAAAVAVVTSIILGVFIRSMLIGSMSNIHHAMAALDYLKKNTVKLNEARDTFLFMTVKRRPRSSGKGSSRGSGHSGGGGGGGGSF